MRTLLATALLGWTLALLAPPGGARGPGRTGGCGTAWPHSSSRTTESKNALICSSSSRRWSTSHASTSTICIPIT